MNKIGDRLRSLIKSSGSNNKIFAENMGVSANYISILIKKNEIPNSFKYNITKVMPNVNLDWLITGEGEMMREVSLDKNILNQSIYYDRLEVFARSKGYKTVNSFGINALKYSSSEKLNRLKKEGTKPSIDVLIDITNIFVDFNIHWYVTGKGEMLLSESTESTQKVLSEESIQNQLDVIFEKLRTIESSVSNQVAEEIKIHLTKSKDKIIKEEGSKEKT